MKPVLYWKPLEVLPARSLVRVIHEGASPPLGIGRSLCWSEIGDMSPV
jgi:hypothetical protein